MMPIGRISFALRLLPILACLTFGFASSLHAADDDVSQAQRAAILKTFRDEITPFLKSYCTECHGDRRSKKGDVTFNGVFGRPGAGESRRVWQLSMVNVQEHSMPPEDANKQPTDEERKKFLEWIPRVKYLNPKDPGAFVIRRLNKVEYGNTLRDLLGVDPSIARDLPDEVPLDDFQLASRLSYFL